MFKSNNPFFKNKSFTNTSRAAEKVHEAVVIDYNETMTVSGTINKTIFMLLGLMASAGVTWFLIATGALNPFIPLVAGAILGIVFVLVVSFKPQHSAWVAPGYAIFEGLFIGALSAIFEAMYPGIVIQAVAATFVTFLVCLGLYRAGIVKVTERFKSVVIGATMAIALYYLLSWISTFFINYQPIHHGNSLMSIGISVFVIVIAALNLFLDFDQIEKGAQQRHPKFMEWFGAMGLIITLVWLYVEFLRLLSKLASRD
ncbi:MAG: Bax inhibitor-1/YccA family protein [Flavobacterium sp.]|uniref:Bax inhibitor-1/YccA family protein n=1 Tax=Flavobacterium sp. TaxID=239 RepID=UPI00121848E8|nr:Bax inhibitor-1/YccA family protein [Flavobacterium sp.]RZJ68061.1 MAG: Bax inhibitor-1/YccA family protein [Flavobacterium sp.]